MMEIQQSVIESEKGIASCHEFSDDDVIPLKKSDRLAYN
jgi:hypothetical protein